jgi:hypothetical protein
MNTAPATVPRDGFLAVYMTGNRKHGKLGNIARYWNDLCVALVS